LFTRSPLPPNRTCGSPASGSPVGSFTSAVNIESNPMSRKQTYCLLSPPLPGAANIRSVHTAGSARGNLPQVSPPCSGHTPTDGGLFPSASLLASTFLASFAPCPLRHINATMMPLTPDGLSYPPGLPPSCTQPSYRSIPNHLMAPAIALTRYPSA